MSEPRYSRERDAVGRWWCTVHNRWATRVLDREGMKPEHVCDPALGGITMPCEAVEFDALLWLRSKQGQYAGYPVGSQDNVRHEYFKVAADEIELVRAVMAWTSAKPTEPGKYWFRDGVVTGKQLVSVYECEEDGESGLYVQTDLGGVMSGAMDYPMTNAELAEAIEDAYQRTRTTARDAPCYAEINAHFKLLLDIQYKRASLAISKEPA